MGAIDAIFALAIAFIFYGAGPLYLASERKKPIQKLHYWLFCIIYDVVVITVLVMLTTDTGFSYRGIGLGALALGTIFYFIGLSILYKHGMVAGSPTQPATPPVQPAAPQPPAEPEAASVPTPEPIPEAVPAPKPQETPTQPISPSPITETWYTCPSCGCLLPTGEICSCGYHPQVEVQAPVKKRRPSVAVIILAVVLACSVLYNAAQAKEKADLRSNLSQVDTEIASYQKEINDYKDAVESAREHNLYLKEDLAYLCPGLSSSFKEAEFRHDFRNNSLSYPTGKQESVAYWQQVDLQIAYGIITWNNK